MLALRAALMPRPIWLALVIVMQFMFTHITDAQVKRLSANDIAALKAVQSCLYDQIAVIPGGAGLKFFDTWDFNKDPCSFEGVLCDMPDGEGGELRVAELNLGIASGSSAGLGGRLHPELGSLTEMVQLTLAPGKVSGSIPTALAQLSKLENLGLSHNLLTGSIPGGLGSLSRLTSLDLAFNRLSGSIPRELGTLPNLVSLRLAHNRLTGTLPPSFSATPLLEHLDASRNALTGALPSQLPPSLTYLNLARNQLIGGLSNLVADAAKLSGLSWVDLSHNQLSGLLPSSLLTAPQLTYLSLQHNFLSGPVSPPQLVLISTLDLSVNQLSGPISPYLAFVRDLYLNNNRFTGSVPQEFVDQLLSASMHTLYLHHNFLTRFPLSPSLSLPMTASVCVQYNCMIELPALHNYSPCPAHNAGHVSFSRPSTECKNS